VFLTTGSSALTNPYGRTSSIHLPAYKILFNTVIEDQDQRCKSWCRFCVAGSLRAAVSPSHRLTITLLLVKILHLWALGATNFQHQDSAVLVAIELNTGLDYGQCEERENGSLGDEQVRRKLIHSAKLQLAPARVERDALFVDVSGFLVITNKVELQ
jgi:hypothetical protein